MSLDRAWLREELAKFGIAHIFLEEHSKALCEAFGAERITVYALNADQDLESIHQRGLEKFRRIILPRHGGHSIAGWVAVRGELVNLADCYDEVQLAALNLNLLKAVDQRTGFRTRQMLAAPVFSRLGGSVIGVVQLLNRGADGKFPPECEDDIRFLCEALAPTASYAAARHRRNGFATDPPKLPVEILGLDELMTLAEASFREDAPEPAAQARERVVNAMRNAQKRTGHLDPYDVRGSAVDVAHRGDIRALEWLCRLAAAGHVGADRLVDRALTQDPKWRLSDEPEGVHLKSVANRFPRVARALARSELRRDDRDFDVILDWLDVAGECCRGVAATLRELYAKGESASRREWEIIDRHVRLATQAGEQSSAVNGKEELLAAIEWIRAEKAWFERTPLAADPAESRRKWLEKHSTPEGAPGRLCMDVGAAIEAGRLGLPPDLPGALKWYRAALRTIGHQWTEPIEADFAACARIGSELHKRPENAAMADDWLERGVIRGDEFCFLAWLHAQLKRKDADAPMVLERATAFYAPGGAIRPILNDQFWVLGECRKSARRREQLEPGVPQWLELGRRLGVARDMFAADHSIRER